MATAINPQTGERIRYDEGQGQWVPMEAQAEAEPQKARGSLFDSLMQGLTLGYADELGGFGAKLGSALAGAPSERIGRAGERETAAQRERLADIRERAFWPSLALEAGGALVSGGPLAKGLHAGFRGAGLGKLMAPIMTGATEGGIAGAGAADEEKMLGAAIGAPLGGITAGAMPLVGGGLKLGWDKVSPLARKAFEGPETTAGRVLAESLQGAGETPTRLKARQRQLGPQANLIDIAGPAGVGLGQGVIQADPLGQAVTLARREMGKRAKGSTGRLKDDLTGITGVKQRLQPSLDEVRARQKAESDPAYDLAYGKTISLTPKLKSILGRPPMQDAWKKAQRAALTRGEDLPPFLKLDEFGDWEKSGVMPDMRSWNHMKKGLDRLIAGETDNITGRVSEDGVDIIKLKKAMLKELDDINPAYADARSIFAGDEAIQNAMREGERFLGMKTREVTSAVKDMTDSEKESFMTGAMEAIREKMGRARAGEIGEFRFLETGGTKEKLRAMFPDGREGDKQLAELMRVLDRERTFATTQGQTIGNSQTAMRQAAGEAITKATGTPTTVEALANPLSVGVPAAMRAASEAVSGMGPKAINQLGQMAFDPQQTNRAILEMQRRGISPVDWEELLAKYARGGARVAPLPGLAGGEIANQ